MANRMRVLVVDDDPAIRALVRTILGRAGFVVDTARDGCEAIDMIAETEYDGVILDVMMPRLDGLGVIDVLQHVDAALLERTLVLTASHLKSLQELPVFGVMSKPFGNDELLERTRACVGCSPVPMIAIAEKADDDADDAQVVSCGAVHEIEIPASATEH